MTDVRSDDAPVVVTGATGFLAGHCILQLLEAGHAVRGTLRDASRGDGLRATLARHGGDVSRVELVTADLSSDAGWDAAMAGASRVLHVASPLPRVIPKDPELLIRPAREGALRVLRAARDAGVRRVVMTSSTAAIVYGRGGRPEPFTEADWSDPDGADHTNYTRSKTIAERAAWDFVAEEAPELEFTTVNPGLILGPVLEADYGTSAEAVLKLLNGDFPGVPRMGFPIVDVRDVADLHLRAMTHPAAPGERFLAATDFLWFSDIAAVLREALPDYAKRMPPRVLPNWLMRLVGLFDPVIGGILVDLDQYRPCDASKPREVLGWQPRSSRDAIVSTARSLIDEGLVKPL